MPWSSSIDSGFVINSAHLLPDGRVLLHQAGGITKVLTPNAVGDYLNGTLTRLADAPLEHVACNVTVDLQGRLYFHGGEYGTGAAKTSMFDPATNAWSTVNGGLNASHEPVWQMADSTTLAVNPANNAQKFRVGSIQDISFYTAPNTFTRAPGWQASECCPFLLPDGRIMVFMASVGANFTEVVGSNDGRSVATYNNGAGANGVIQTFDFSGFTKAFHTPTNDRWTSHGSYLGYETSSSGYMAKVNKAVLVGGDGFLYAINIATFDNPTTRASSLERYPLPPLPSMVGQTSGMLGFASYASFGASFTAPSTLNINCTGYESFASFVMSLWPAEGGFSNHFVHVRTDGNTNARRLQFTGASYNSGTATLTLTGVSAVTGDPKYSPGGGQVSNSFPIEVITCDPYYCAKDETAWILPNGDYVFTAGTNVVSSRSNYFNSLGVTMKWDGSSNPTIYDTETSSQLIALPDGTYFSINGFGIVGGQSYRIYTPTTSEAIPQANSIPLISDAPNTVQKGQRVSVTGKRFNGSCYGSFGNDEGQFPDNFPIVEFKDPTSSAKWYGRTTNFSTRGIDTTSDISCTVIVPSDMPIGEFEMRIVARGIKSSPVNVSILPTGDPIFINYVG